MTCMFHVVNLLLDRDMILLNENSATIIGWAGKCTHAYVEIM